MRRTIWKYPIAVDEWSQIFEIPGFERIVSIGLQGSHPVFWAIVDPTLPEVKVEVAVEVTGGRMPINPNAYEIAGTYQVGPFVGHVFWRVVE